MYLSNKCLLSDSNNMPGRGDSGQDRKTPAYVPRLLEAQAPVHSLPLFPFF